MATVRLQKVLAAAGVASRRAAEEMITAGRVRVDGQLVTQLGTKVDPRSSRVEVDGQRVVRESAVYVVLHKPRGVVSTMHDPEGRPSVRELLADAAGRVYPVGRLDFNTSGVLVATNDGELADALLHPRRSVPKTYVVKVQGVMEDRDLDGWRRGVDLDDGKTQPAKVRLLRHEGDKTWLELTITEGRNQQVRRMGDATGFRVMRLARLSFAGIDAEGLAPGRWRYLTADELRTLKKQYGVPRRVVSPPTDAPQAEERRIAVRPRAPERAPSGEGRGPSGDGRRPTGERGSSGDGRRPTGERGPSGDGRRPTGKRGPSGDGRRPTGTRGPSGDGRRPTDDPRGNNPRYGGGAPARRDPGVTEDWGGGVRRGSSGHRDAGESSEPTGGRHGRTRTTGTSGGIGASGGSYRIGSRRRSS
jgi:23S rRNA pseudouridine2605 synthase